MAPPVNIHYPQAVSYDIAVKTLLDAVNTDVVVNTKRPADSRQTVYVAARLSVAAATVAIEVVLYDKAGAVLGVSGAQTATAGVYRDAAAGLYHAPVLAFDLAGAFMYEVRSAAASSGTRTLKTWAV